jgi:hypothetical protein
MDEWKFASAFALTFLTACGEPKEQVITRCYAEALTASAAVKAGEEVLSPTDGAITCARRAGYHYQPKLLCASVSAADPACYSSSWQRSW